jgi:quinol monooxygenase YgiN
MRAHNEKTRRGLLQRAGRHSALERRSLEAGAVSEFQGIARFKFHEGKPEEYKRLSAQAMEIVRTKDTGTLQYEIYFNDDQSEYIVLERYRDSEALIEHLANLGDLGAAILATGSVSGELLGEPSAKLRAKMADSVVRLFTPYLSMWTPLAGLDEAAPTAFRYGHERPRAGARGLYYPRHAMGLDLARHGSALMKAVEGFP